MLILSILLLSIVATKAHQPSVKCQKPHEEYNECGTACEHTCNNRPTMCTFQCVEGCFCKEGYIRKEINDTCILISDCDNLSHECPKIKQEINCGTCNPTCDDNSKQQCRGSCRKDYYFKNSISENDDETHICPPRCKSSEVCNCCPKYCTFDPSCASVINGIKTFCPPASSNYICKPRCECKPGLVRIGSDCVSPKKCCRKPNETLVSCPADCDNTCTKSYPSGTCNLRPCHLYGCKCKKGFVRDELTGQCILFKDCSSSQI